MKRRYLLCALIPIIGAMAGCKNNSSKESETSTAIYEHILESNLKYGSDKSQICKMILKCEPEKIKKKVIIAPSWEVDMFSSHVDSITHISGTRKHHCIVNELDVNGEKITHIMTGMGGCSVIDAVMALGCTPCKEILFIGSVGALDENIKIGDVMIPEYSVCGVGANRYLTSGSLKENDTFGKKYYPNESLYNEILSITNNEIKDTDISLHIGKTYSVDTILTQYAHLDEIINMGCNSIEMETATLFEAAEIANIKAVAVFNVSDNTIANKSLHHDTEGEDSVRRQKGKSEVMPKIALKALKVI